MSKAKLISKNEMLTICEEAKRLIMIYTNCEDNDPKIPRTLNDIEDLKQRIQWLRIP